jgi:hypothetical protein
MATVRRLRNIVAAAIFIVFGALFVVCATFRRLLII